jgi:endo-1,4-beta-xylanase
MMKKNVSRHLKKITEWTARIHNQSVTTIMVFQTILTLLVFGSSLFSQLANGHDRYLGNLYGNNAPHATFDLLWNQLTPENRGKWIYNEIGRDVYDWSGLDAAYNYAITRNFQYKHHTLIWGSSQGTPYWLPYLDSLEQAAEIEEWIMLVAQRYPEADLVDVVNHPINAPPSYLNAMGGPGITGWDWIIWAFQKSRLYFPDSTILLLNEYNILNGTTDIDSFIQIINLLKADSLIDGIGCQGHYLETIDSNSIRTRIDQLAATGLPIYIGGYDVNLADDSQQLAVYQEQFPVFWNHPSIKGVTLWGYVQGQIYQTNAYLLRSNGTERPALQWLRSYLTGTGINDKQINVHIPSDHTLFQNYPNPFNPTTTIKYNLPKASKVRLTIYNVHGEKIRTLLDGFQAAGEHTIRWDAKSERNHTVPSGIYFYRLETTQGNFQKKMVLLK